jgi:hypothetical protein
MNHRCFSVMGGAGRQSCRLVLEGVGVPMHVWQCGNVLVVRQCAYLGCTFARLTYCHTSALVIYHHGLVLHATAAASVGGFGSLFMKFAGCAWAFLELPSCCSVQLGMGRA